MFRTPAWHRFVLSYIRGPEHPAKLRLVDWLLRYTGRMRVQTDFGLMDLDPQDAIQKAIIYDGSYEPKTLQLILSLLRDDGCFVDVGANVGQFSLAASGKLQSGSGVVLAIEPNPRICAELWNNCRLNGLERRISIVCTAVSSDARLGRIHIPDEKNRGTSRELAYGCGDFIVAYWDMSELLRYAGVSSPDVVKIDTEGAEFNIIRSLLKSHRPAHIIFEFIPEAFSYEDEETDLIALLLASGYELRTVEGRPFERGQALPEHNLWAVAR